MEKHMRTLGDLEQEASSFIDALVPNPERATLITLSGELGAGKTAFTKAVAATLGVTDTVTSPTFVLEKIYSLDPQRGGETPKFERLIHIDAYRLDRGDDLMPLGFAVLLRDPKNLILLEWPEKVGDALPKPAVSISLAANADGSRTMIYV